MAITKRVKLLLALSAMAVFAAGGGSLVVARFVEGARERLPASPALDADAQSDYKDSNLRLLASVEFPDGWELGPVTPRPYWNSEVVDANAELVGIVSVFAISIDPVLPPTVFVSDLKGHGQILELMSALKADRWFVDLLPIDLSTTAAGPGYGLSVAATRPIPGTVGSERLDFAFDSRTPGTATAAVDHEYDPSKLAPWPSSPF